MKYVRIVRVGLAICVALGALLITTLSGCVTKSKTQQGPPRPDISRPPVNGDPPAPLPKASGMYDSVHVFNHALFENDSAALSESAKGDLDKLAAELKNNSHDTVVLEGHASNTGTHEYNMALGLRRAEAAKAYLMGKGIAAGRIQIESFGDLKPCVANNTPKNRALNRRVSFRYTVRD